MVAPSEFPIDQRQAVTVHYGSHGHGECGATDDEMADDPAAVTCRRCRGWLPIVTNPRVDQRPSADYSQMRSALRDRGLMSSTDHMAEAFVSVCALLEEILAEVKRGNSIERTGSVSSVTIEDNPTRDLKVRVSSKTYAGSVLPVDEALADRARLHREAESLALSGWSETVS